MDTTDNGRRYSLQGNAKRNTDFEMKTVLIRNIYSLEREIIGIQNKINALRRLQLSEYQKKVTIELSNGRIVTPQIPDIYVELDALQDELREKSKKLEDMRKQLRFFTEPESSKKDSEEGKEKPKRTIKDQTRKKELLPLKDGFQIYNQILEESKELGVKFNSKSAYSTSPWIKSMPIAITSGATAIGTIILPGIGTYVGLGTGLAVSAALKPLVEKLTGRKKDTEKIFSVIDELPDDDIELLIDDFLLKDRENPETLQKKTHELFFDAIQKKCKIEAPRKVEEFQELMNAEIQKKQTLERGLIRAKDESTVDMYNTLILQADKRIKTYEKKARKWKNYSVFLEDAKKNNSLERHENLGGMFAKRDIDNTKDIKELSKIDLEKLNYEYRAEAAEKAGDQVSQRKYLVLAQKKEAQMKRYMASKTVHLQIGKRTYSMGAFEAPEGEIKEVSAKEYVLPKIAYGIVTAAAISVATAYRIFKNGELQNSRLSEILSNKRQELESGISNANAANSTKAESLSSQLMQERTGYLNDIAKVNGEPESVRMARVVEEINSTGDKTRAIMQDGKLSGLDKFSALLKTKAESARNSEASFLENAAKSWYAKVGQMAGNGVDHSQTIPLEEGTSKIVEAQANLYDQMSGFVGKVGNFLSSPIKVKADYLQVLIANAPLLGKFIENIRDRKKEKVTPSKANNNVERAEEVTKIEKPIEIPDLDTYKPYSADGEEEVIQPTDYDGR